MQGGGEMSAAPPPDILWIVTTQWRAQACGYAGDPNARTPALDALARTSVNYTQAVTPHPFGPFARAALLTGVPSPENGVRDYYDSLPLDARTIAHDLGERGYVTGFFGKWHLAKRDPQAALVGEAHARMIVPPEARGGFSFWEGFESGFVLNDPWLHGTALPEPVRFPGYQSDVIGTQVRQWLGWHSDTRPWFAVASFEAPHPPYDAPAAGVSPALPDSIALAKNLPLGGEPEKKARRELAGYYAHIAATDRAIGKLVAELDTAAARHGRQKPIVVFTSVHGDMHGAHGLFRKGWPHEESIRMPLLVRAPGMAARSDDSAISLLDLSAMTLAWADAKPEAKREHFSRISMPSVVRLQLQCDRVWRGVRTPQRKLVLNNDGSPWLFFDLERDPLEQRNLVGDVMRAAEVAEWRQKMAPSE